MMSSGSIVRDYRLDVLSGHRAAHVLACWGLASLLPGATLHFEGNWATPVFRWKGEEGSFSEIAARGLVEHTWDLDEGVLRDIRTTTPLRSVVNDVARRAWEESGDAAELTISNVVQVFDMSTSSEKKNGAGLQVGSAALTLLSGTSYTENSVRDTWKLLGAERITSVEVAALAAEEIDRLLRGEITVVDAKPGLRFSTSDPLPRTKTGSERCDVQPLIDLLAFCGQLLLQSLQYSLVRSRPIKAFTWFLNPVPLAIEVIVDIHESPPPGLIWPRWTSEIRPIAKGASASYLAAAVIENTSDISGGYDA